MVWAGRVAPPRWGWAVPYAWPRPGGMVGAVDRETQNAVAFTACAVMTGALLFGCATLLYALIEPLPGRKELARSRGSNVR